MKVVRVSYTIMRWGLVYQKRVRAIVRRLCLLLVMAVCRPSLLAHGLRSSLTCAFCLVLPNYLSMSAFRFFWRAPAGSQLWFLPEFHSKRCLPAYFRAESTNCCLKIGTLSAELFVASAPVPYSSNLCFVICKTLLQHIRAHAVNRLCLGRVWGT